MLSIYIALYSATPRNKQPSMETRIASVFCPPFTHVELVWRLPGQQNVMAFLTATRRDGVIAGARPIGEGYSWLEIPVRRNQMDALFQLSTILHGRGFDSAGMFRSAVTCLARPPPGIHTDKWFCSQVVIFALQHMGILSRAINASLVHTTEVYIIARAVIAGCKGVHGPHGGSGVSADDVFTACWRRPLVPDDIRSVPAIVSAVWDTE